MVTWSRRAILAGALGGAFGAAAGASASDGPLRIGVLDSNPGAEYRAQALKSESGTMIELIVHSDGVDEAHTRDAAASLLDQGVHALIGPATPWLADATTAFADAACTPMVLPAPGTLSPFVFAAGPTPLQAATAMLKASAPHKLGLLALDKLSTPDGVDVERFPVTATDLTAPLKALVAAKPDVVAVLAPPPFDAMALRDAKVAGWTGPVLLPPTAVGVAAPDGTQIVAPWLAAPQHAPESLPQTATLRRFVAGFGPVNMQSASGADAVTLLHLAFLGHRDRKMARDQLDKMCCLGVCGVYEMGRLRDDALAPMTMLNGVWTPDKGQ